MQTQFPPIQRRAHMAGITLIELMVVMVIIGALAAFAIPSYRQYTIRAQRTDAKTALLQLATNQERFYLQNNSYTNDLNSLGFAAGESERGLYTLNVGVANANTFEATATLVSTTDQDCLSFTINAQGLRTADPDPNTDCW
jgi:type IV pilus assembly protein PilE